ncbi:hypothetical protein VITU102760_08685 [Vibrio tubiashii]|uniref:DNA repair protein n=1 Tax=Vibrio tubiashii ATCC 19109 TaxID=1051646 RepID=F9TDT3_9VIBR|nr:hypothetical protein [Vibrio tubiashii]AIW14110.1 hypothetical protein IX91_07850 [Vibrio tubiashii ATCC 19109]EGU46665.1 hypothetical protein VITU9109_04787 [Vibrio tubiashii ATCC 19109]EIF02939.1 hypothetical protein VT1337_16469 [Vibrio tubiashii NCIMB 1337 = ATCC 19106]
MIYAVIGLAVGVLGLYLYQFGFGAFSTDQGVWGAFGDYLGGVLNPVIALLALIYLAKTYQTQKDELKETKKALLQSAKSHQEQAHEQKFANELQKKANALEEKNQRISLLQAQISCISAILEVEIDGQNTLVGQLNECSKEMEELGNGIGNKTVTPEYRKQLIARSKNIRKYLEETDLSTRKLQSDLAEIRKELEKLATT